ncbi:osteocalcin 2-like isoform X2 [Anthonomus grandis grandis]|uniref:osteocalcin 2-like isoform X2 n=1 Tax=Anthonomus grandis grandis TaxID=2921223 RepID=UPI00216549AE|nr:osteocalcin 2-like isoform X2 [Anthonomus grandis grandis]
MSSSRARRIIISLALDKKPEHNASEPNQALNSGYEILKIPEIQFVEDENAAPNFDCNTNYNTAKDADKNKPCTSFPHIEFSPELKNNAQMSDLVSDNDDDSVKDPNYKSDDSSDSSSSSSSSSASSSSSCSGCSNNSSCSVSLSSSNVVGQALDTEFVNSQEADSHTANTLVANIQSANAQDTAPQAGGTQE